ncbi:MAG: sulfatase-like hydrolase/transferase [Paludibaculum sp.]
MNRRQFLGSAGAAAALRAAPSRPPNIVVLYSDDQRFNTIGALGNKDIRTPNIDRLVGRGVAFERAHIMGGTGGAVCVASRAMLLTGQTLFRATSNMDSTPPPPVMLMGEHFGKAGFSTYGIGKWHNAKGRFNQCFQNGAAIFFGGMADHLKTPIQDYDPAGRYGKDRERLSQRFSSEMFADEAIRFLQSADRSKPFFLYTAFTAPHDPRMAPEAFRNLYSADRLKPPENFLPQHPFDNGELQVRDELLAGFPRQKSEVTRHLADYYAMITHLDHHIGRILDTLQATGLERDTIVVFAGDNGLALGQHGLMGKQSLYDHSVRVPLILAGPGCASNQRRHELCYNLDIFPTLCDLTGTKAPAGVEGMSLLRGRRESVFFAYRHFQRGVRTDEWKLILYMVEGKSTAQLFHMKSDPWEMRNLIDTPKHAGKAAELRALLKDWMRKTGDPMDLDKPNWGNAPAA